MCRLLWSLWYWSAAILHVMVVHALVSLHAGCAYTLCTAGQQPLGSRSDAIGQSLYHIMVLEFDPLFWGLFVRAPFPTDAHARVQETGAYPIGDTGACLPGDALTLCTMFLLLCVGYMALHAAVYARRERHDVSASLAIVSHAAGWLLGLLSCGVSLAIVVATDPAVLWPTRAGPFLPPRDIVICATVASGFYILGVFSVEQHVRRWRAYASGTRCRCGHDLSGVAHKRCPECGVDLGEVGHRNRFAWSATRRYRFLLLALILACAATTGLIAWSFVPLRWQWSWRDEIDYKVANLNNYDDYGNATRPSHISVEEWELYVAAWRERVHERVVEHQQR